MYSTVQYSSSCNKCYFSDYSCFNLLHLIWLCCFVVFIREFCELGHDPKCINERS
jgi:hypothetical protein